MEVFASFFEVDDEVADELSWSVVGGLSAAADFDVRVR